MNYRLLGSTLLLSYLLSSCSIVEPPETLGNASPTPKPISAADSNETSKPAMVHTPAKVAPQPSSKKPAPAAQKMASPLKQPARSTRPVPPPSTKMPQKTNVSPKLAKIHGFVEITGKKNKKYRPSNVIVTLTPKTVGSKILDENGQSAKATHQIDMRKKTYSPIVQTVRKGDTLQFNNKDGIKHNVFSSSGDNTFDLGTFKGGGVRSIALNHPGIVKVYCNIHPEMAMFVMVTEHALHASTNKDGKFSLENIPSGDYELTLWHIRGELKKFLSISEGENLVQHLKIDASGYKRVAHKNKFGKNYAKKPALFEDEFY